MAVPLPHYAKIKDRYCIGYFGTDSQVVRQLFNARPIIEAELPGIQIYLALRDEYAQGQRVIPLSATRWDLKDVAYFREIQGTHQERIVEALLEESDIPFTDADLNGLPVNNDDDHRKHLLQDAARCVPCTGTGPLQSDVGCDPSESPGS